MLTLFNNDCQALHKFKILNISFVYLLEYKATILTCTYNFKGLQTGLTGFLIIESVNKNFKWNIGFLFIVLCDLSAFLPLCFKDLKGLETG